MSKILTSGCGISWSAQERPSWVKVLKICGLDIDDRGGPAISNQLILNKMIEAVLHNNYSHAVCQLTSTGKLDVEITDQKREQLVSQDTIRNFKHGNYWPSSDSDEHKSKKMYYEFLHSPTLEQKDIVYKWLLLKKICDEKSIKLHTILGYKINWRDGVDYKLIDTDHAWSVYEDHTQGEYYRLHDHSLGTKNTVPNKHFMIYLADRINKEFLKFDIGHKLSRFHG